MEKGNQVDTGTSVRQATPGNGGGATPGGGGATPGGAAPGGGGATPGGGQPAPPDVGTDTGTTGTPPPVAPGGGGGSQADQTGPQRDWLNQLSEQEVEYPDGSKMRLGNGGAEYQEGEDSARLEGDRWIDTKTGTAWEGEMGDRANQKLWDMEQGLRLNPPRQS